MLIHCKLLELILFKVDRHFGGQGQLYVSILYKTIFIIGYYGLFRIGELVKGAHTIKAKNVHVAQNKEKILIMLYTSKMTGVNSHPQKIKITSVKNHKSEPKRFFCPFLTIREFIRLRGGFSSNTEHFFVMQDGSEIAPMQVRKVLQKMIELLNLRPHLYNTHSLRLG